MKKIIITLTILILIYVGITYAANVFLPKKIDAALKNFISENLQKDVSLSQIKVNLIKGISFKDVKIYDKDDRDIYLQANNINIRPLYTSFFYTKKIFLNVSVQNAYFKLVKDSSGKLNLPKIKTDAKNTNILIIKDINARALTIDFEDQANSFKKEFSKIDFKTRLSLTGIISLETKWKNHLSLSANFNLRTKDLKGVATLSNIDLTEFNPFFKNFIVKNALLKDGSFSFKGNKEYAIEGDISIKEIDLIKDEITLRGDLTLKPTLTFYRDKKNFKYSLSGKLFHTTVENIPHVNSLQDTTAIFNIDKENITISSLKTKVFGKTIDLSSKIDYSQYPDYSLIAESSLPLVQLINLAKKIYPFSFEYNESGNIDLQLNLQGNAEKQKAKYIIHYNIKNASLKYLDKIDAKGTLKKDSLLITEGKLYYKDTPFDLEVELIDFSSPQLSFNIKNTPLNLKAYAIYSKNNIAINDIVITGPDTDINATAQIDFKKDPMVIIEGSGLAGFSDIRKILDLLKLDLSAFDKLNPQGISNIKFTVNGNSDINLWQVKLTGRSDKLKIYNLEAQNTSLELYRDEDELIINPLTAKLAQGKIKCLAKLNLGDNSGKANILINDIDLSHIKDGLELEDAELSGKLSLEAFVESKDLRKMGKLDGQGIIEVKEGNIWEISFFEGLGEFLFIPDFAKIKFQEGYSDIFFQGRDIIFENLELNSHKMTLNGAGKINLDNNIHFMFFPQFNPRVVASSEGLKKITTQFLGKSGLVIEVQGTLEDPTYEMKPIFLSPLDKIKGFFENIAK